MIVGNSGNQRLVCNTKYLVGARQVSQFIAHRLQGFAGQSGFDFVEDNRGTQSLLARCDLIASITRESSPPEAIFATGINGWPGLGQIINSMRSMPFPHFKLRIIVLLFFTFSKANLKQAALHA